MSTGVKADIEKALNKIFTEWAMMIVDDEDEQADDLPDDEMYKAWLHFDGDFQGCYSICCGGEFASELAGNLIGEFDSDPSISDQLDALKELINIISGNLLTTCFTEDWVFALTAPEATRISKEEFEDITTNSKTFFSVEGMPVFFSWTFSDVD